MDVLKSTVNTQQIAAEIKAEAEKRLGLLHPRLYTTFEHGQWWVTCLECGDLWSVVDCQDKQGIYLNFEIVSGGDSYCLDKSRGIE